MNETKPMETILGKATVTVEKLDGTTETVEVRQFHLDACQRYLELLDDELAQVEFLCGKQAGWAKTLKIESVENLLATGERLNWDFFERWLQRRLKRMAAITGGQTAVVDRFASMSGSQKPVSPAG